MGWDQLQGWVMVVKYFVMPELQLCEFYTNNPLLDLLLQLCTNPVQNFKAECNNIYLLMPACAIWL